MGHRAIRTVTVKKASRQGYTIGVAGVHGFWIDVYGWNCGIYQPDAGDAAKFKADEINPLLRDTLPIRNMLKAGDPDKKSKWNTLERVEFTNGKKLYILGGASGGNYRGFTWDSVTYDELSGFLHNIDKEGSAVRLGDVRVKAAPWPKSLRGSTPKVQGTCQISRSLRTASIVLKRHLPCPHCGELHVLSWNNFVFDHLDTERTAAFGCPECGAEYGYQHYSAMDDYENGARWMDSEGTYLDEDLFKLCKADGTPLPWPRHVGMQMWGAYSYIQTWGMMAQEWLEANNEWKETGDTSELQTFTNTVLGEEWVEARDAIQAEDVYKRREVFEADIPKGVIVLTLGVDTQDDRLECTLLGSREKERWILKHWVLPGDPKDGEVWKMLDRIRNTIFYDADGEPYQISGVAVDTQGHRTQEVYEYCRVRYGEQVYAIRGQGGEGLPSTRKPTQVIAQSLEPCWLYSLGVDAFKSRLMENLRRKPGEPGYHHLAAVDSLELDWVKQLVSEYLEQKLEKGVYVRRWLKRQRRNEGLDCVVYAEAALEILNPVWEYLVPNDDDEAGQAPPPEEPDMFFPLAGMVS